MQIIVNRISRRGHNSVERGAIYHERGRKGAPLKEIAQGPVASKTAPATN